MTKQVNSRNITYRNELYLCGGTGMSILNRQNIPSIATNQRLNSISLMQLDACHAVIFTIAINDNIHNI
jgi:hypothetical protein